MTGAATEDAERACTAGECEKAIDLLERAVRLRPCDFQLHYRLGLCYSRGCRPHKLVHPDMAVSYLRQALRLVGANPGRTRAAVLDQLGNALLQSGSTPGTAVLRAAIECHIEAAEVCQSLGMSDDWGRIQFNLGNSYCDLSEITGEDHWREAALHYEESLRVRTPGKDPERHAAVLENLGSAYRRLPGDGNGDNVKKSIKCYRRALRIYATRSHPDKSAGLQNNLGNAFLSLPDTDEKARARNARRALLHFDRALRLQSRDKCSRAYGITQYNRAQAHFRLAQTSGSADSKIAVMCLEEAFKTFQSYGEDRYMQLARAQWERICRQ